MGQLFCTWVLKSQQNNDNHKTDTHWPYYDISWFDTFEMNVAITMFFVFVHIRCCECISMNTYSTRIVIQFLMYDMCGMIENAVLM